MENKMETVFNPDYSMPPGTILEDILSNRGIKKIDLADRCGMSEKHMSQITNGKASISPETAIQLETVLGISAITWTNLESHYRLFLAKQEAKANLRVHANWIKKFPVNDMAANGLIARVTDGVDWAREILRFFGVASIEAWESRFKKMAEAHYRDSVVFKSDPISVATWLRLGEKIAEGIDTEPYNREKFQESLKNIRQLTKESPQKFEPLMREHCRKAGVALIFVPGLSKSRLCGATRWLQPKKALIMLSLRYHWEDIFWFTFYHESAHILNHNKKERFINDAGDKNERETEADTFAARFLIPDAQYRAFTSQGSFSRLDILKFAQQMGIAPGIIVGRLQHDKLIDYKWHNKLRRRFTLEASS